MSVCLVLSLFAVFAQSMSFVRVPIDRSLFYTTPQFIQAEGYLAQKYDVLTNDGYILGLFRISDNSTMKRPPVLLMHGMTCSSDSWLFQGRKKDLAYMLYDAGYDVWLGDVRGNVYSRRHVTIPPSDPSFWQFSWHEHGVEDLPAIINTIIGVTGYSKINYVGHSMGTTSFFVMGSEKPEMMNKINLFVGLSPVAAMDFKDFSPEKKVIIDTANRLSGSLEQKGYFEVLTRVWFAPFLSNSFCNKGSLTQNLCYDVTFFWAGSKKHRISKKVLARVMSHVPAGLPVYTPLHFMQNMYSGKFRARDLGPALNQFRYNAAEPPEYNLSRVTCPVSLHFSEGDFLINASDVRRNMKKLPNVVDVHEYDGYNHIDYVWGRSAWRELYVRVIQIFNKFNNMRI